MDVERDTLAQVGLGAMILFIGSLIAITSSMYVMIAQLESISQSGQKVISVATKESHTQIIFMGAWIDDGYDDYLLMIEYQSLGEEVLVEEVAWVLWCEHNDNTHRRMGWLGDEVASAPNRVTIWEVGEEIILPETLVSGKRYFIVADGGTGTGNGAGTFCGPQWIFDRGVPAHYSIYLPFGGHITQEFRVNQFAVGNSVT
tara:strand:- start:157 stop:759 length:603 start_codon:yes stop_codon:yes gene_type:complete